MESPDRRILHGESATGRRYRLIGFDEEDEAKDFYQISDLTVETVLSSFVDDRIEFEIYFYEINYLLCRI